MSGGQLGSRRPTRQRNTLLPQEPLRWMGRRALWLDRRLPRPSQWSLSDGIGTAAAQQPNVALLCLWFPRKLSHASWKRLGWTRYWPGAWPPTTLMPRPTGRLLKEARQTPEPSFWARWCSRLNYATLILRALACSALGSTSVTTPSFISALILPWSILLEIWKLRT